VNQIQEDARAESKINDKKGLWEQEVSSLEDPATPAKSRSLCHQEIVEKDKKARKQRDLQGFLG